MHEKVSRAFEEGMRRMEHQMNGQQDFIAFVESFRQNVTQELLRSAQDIAVATKEAMSGIGGLSEVSIT